MMKNYLEKAIDPQIFKQITTEKFNRQIKMIKAKYIDKADPNSQRKRITHWDRLSPHNIDPKSAGAFYYRLLYNYRNQISLRSTTDIIAIPMIYLTDKNHEN